MASPSRLPFRTDIQGLRAVAVALVVLAHAGIPGFEGGYVGVDVFFVLSGFLITGLLLDEHRATGAIAYGRFLSRRLRRLLPALLLMLVVVLVVAWLVLTPYEASVQGRSFPYAATWTSNFFFALGERNYFDALEAKDLYLHTWSLGVEEQFYIVWPWLIILLCGGRLQRGGPHPAQKIFVAVFVLSLALCIFLSATVPILSFYMMPARGWQFALGAVVYVVMCGSHVPRYQHSASAAVIRNASLFGSAGLLLLLICPLTMSDTISYPGAYALIPSFGAAIIIASGILAPKSLVPRLLSMRPIVWIGDRSYSIYLWHWPVLILGGTLSWGRSGVGIAISVAISIILATISYRFVELPFWKGKFRGARPRKVAVYSVLAVIAATSLDSSLDRAAERKFAGPADYDPRKDWPADIYGSGVHCDTTTDSAEVIPCEIGHGSGNRLAIIWGDSIGVQWSPLVRQVYSSPGWRVLVLTKSACAIVDHTYYYDVVGGDFTVCARWRENALQYIRESNPEVLIIGSSAFYDFTANQWTEASARIFGAVSKIADQVIVIPGTPRLSFDGPACLSNPRRFAFRLGRTSHTCSETMTDSEPEQVSRYLGYAAEGFPNVHVLELGDLVCPENRCAAATAGGTPVYRDTGHLTVRFVETLLPEVSRRMVEQGIAPKSSD